VAATYQGYEPTGDPETELRYYFEITGERKQFDSDLRQLLDVMRTNMINQHPEDAKEINEGMNIAWEARPKFQDTVELVVPIYMKYYTLAELQELNKFYSTATMQQMVKKDPLIQQEMGPVVQKLMVDMQQKMSAIINAKESSSQTPSDHQ
jgi:hypothetical protein